jgi:SDR family mycofactocin-dependent oxidoreductase
VGQFDGKVAYITGGARGQGRAHAVRFAQEGADIITLDICGPVASVEGPSSTAADLEETARLVEQLGRRVVARPADVRDFTAVSAVVDEGLAEFGQIDFVLVNAGIFPVSLDAGAQHGAFHEAVDVMVNGAFHTCEAAIPSMIARGEGGAIVITSSTLGLKGVVVNREHGIPGLLGYTAAKHAVVGLMRAYANSLAPYRIRCNTVHPTGVTTPMVVNEPFQDFISRFPEANEQFRNALPVDSLEPDDISRTMVFLCSDAGQYITGVTLPVDAGFCNR